MKKFIKQYHECITLSTIQSILILLRLFNKITWKWVYVLMPLWIFIAIFIMIIIMAIYVDKNYPFDRNDWNY